MNIHARDISDALLQTMPRRLIFPRKDEADIDASRFSH